MTSDVKWSWLEANKAKSRKIRRKVRQYRPKIDGVRSIIRNIHKYKIPVEDEALKVMFRKLTFYELQEKKLRLFADFLDKNKEGKPIEEWYYKKQFFDEVEQWMEKEVAFDFRFYKQNGWV